MTDTLCFIGVLKEIELRTSIRMCNMMEIPLHLAVLNGLLGML